MKEVLNTCRLCGALFVIFLVGCTHQLTARSNPFTYLYNESDATSTVPTTAQLRLPLRVGLAFVPDGEIERSGPVSPNLWSLNSTSSQQQNAMTEAQKMRLLDALASNFRNYKFVQSIQVLPSYAAKSSAGFADLDKLHSIFGIDAVALIAYDQSQHTDPNRLSLAYWTGVGAYFAKGELIDTQTVVDTLVYHIGSRHLLFHAHGVSNISGKATAIGLARQLREDSAQGYRLAAKNTLTSLDQAVVAQFGADARKQDLTRSEPLIAPTGDNAALDQATAPVTPVSAQPDRQRPPPLPTRATPTLPTAVPSDRRSRAVASNKDTCWLLGWPANTTRAECHTAHSRSASAPAFVQSRQEPQRLNAQRD